ncbi:MAG: RNA-dependent RNA polymerase, partial [Salmon pescarenavirus 2]
MDWSKPIREIRVYNGPCPVVNSVKQWLLGRCEIATVDHKCCDCSKLIKHPRCLLTEVRSSQKVFTKDTIKVSIQCPQTLMIPQELMIEEDLGLISQLERCCRIIGHTTELALCRKLGLPFTNEREKKSYDEFKTVDQPDVPSCSRLTPDAYKQTDAELVIYEFGYNRFKFIKERDDKLKWKPLQSAFLQSGHSIRVETEVVSQIEDIQAHLSEVEFKFIREVKEAQTKCRTACKGVNIWTAYDSLIAATNDGLIMADVPGLAQGPSEGTYNDNYKLFMEQNGCSDELGPEDNYEDMLEEAKTWDGGWSPRNKLSSEVRSCKSDFHTTSSDRMGHIGCCRERIPTVTPCSLSDLLTKMRKILDANKPPDLDIKKENAWKRYCHMLWDANDLYLLPGSNDSLHPNPKFRKTDSWDIPSACKKFLSSIPKLKLPKVCPDHITSSRNLLEALNADRSTRVNRVRAELSCAIKKQKPVDPVCFLPVDERKLSDCSVSLEGSSLADFLVYMKKSDPMNSHVADTITEMSKDLPTQVKSKEMIARMCMRLSTPTYRTPGAVAFFQSCSSCMVVTRTKTSKSRTFWVSGHWESFKAHPERLYPIMNMTEALLMVKGRAKDCGVDLDSEALVRVMNIYEHQSKKTQEMLQGMRYFFMAKNSEFHRVGLVKKLSSTCKNRIEAETSSLIYKWMMMNSELPDSKYFSFLMQKVMKSNLEFGLLEIYLCHLVTKRDSSEGHSLVECFNKFMKPKLRYMDDISLNRRLLCGKDEQNLTFDDFNDDVPLFSRSLFKEFTLWISLRHKLSIKKKLRTMCEPTLSQVANPKSTVVRREVPKLMSGRLDDIIRSKLRVREVKGECILGVVPDEAELKCCIFRPKPNCDCLICEAGKVLCQEDLKEISTHADNAESFEDTISQMSLIMEVRSDEEIKTEICKLFYECSLKDVSKLSDLEKTAYLICCKCLESGQYEKICEFFLLKACRKAKSTGGVRRSAIVGAEEASRRICSRSKYSTRTTTSMALKEKVNSGVEDPRIVTSREASVDFSLYFSIANKEQIGGARELFIGDLNTKLITKRLEEIGRNLTSIFENSCLNNPEREDEFRDLLTRSLTESRSPSTLCLTLDHSKWGPTQCVDAFISLITTVCGEELGLHVDDLKRHMTKKIEIPLLCVERARRKQMAGSELSRVEQHIIKKVKSDTPWVQSVFDMGQGILHNHSDLLGCMTEDFICHKASREVEKEFSLEEGSISVRSMNTSDDSCLFAHCADPPNGWKLSFLKYHSFFSELLNKKISPKSTSDSRIAEFKSRFVTCKSETPAVIKFTTCCLHGLNLNSIQQLCNTSLSLSVNAFNQGSTVEECRLVQSVFFKLFRFITPESDPFTSCDIYLGQFPLPTPDEMMMLNHESIMIMDIIKKLSDDPQLIFQEWDDLHAMLVRGVLTAEEVREKVLESIPSGENCTTCLHQDLKENYSPLRPFGRGTDRELMHHLKRELEAERQVKDPVLRKMQKYLDGKGASHNLRSLRRSLIVAITENLSGSQENLMQSLLTLVFQTRGKFYKSKEKLVKLGEATRNGVNKDYIADLALSLMVSCPWMVKQLSAGVMDHSSPLRQDSGQESFHHFARDPNWVENYVPEIVEFLRSSDKPEATDILMDCGVKARKKYKKTEEKNKKLSLMMRIGEFKEGSSNSDSCLRKSTSTNSHDMLPYCFLSCPPRVPMLRLNVIPPSTSEIMVETFLSLISVSCPGTDLTPTLIEKICMCVGVFLGRSEQEFMRSFMSYDNPSSCVKLCRLMLSSGDASVRLKDIIKLDCRPVNMISVDGWTKEMEPIRKTVWEIPSKKGRVRVTERKVSGVLERITIKPMYMGNFTKADFESTLSPKTLEMCSDDQVQDFRCLLSEISSNSALKVRIDGAISESVDVNSSSRLRLFGGCICQATTSIIDDLDDIRECFSSSVEQISGCADGEPEECKPIYEMKYYRQHAKECLRSCELFNWDILTPLRNSLEKKADLICRILELDFTESNLFKNNCSNPEMSEVLSNLSTPAISCRRDLEEAMIQKNPKEKRRISLLMGKVACPDGELCVQPKEERKIVLTGSLLFRKYTSSGLKSRQIRVNGLMCTEFCDESA